MDVAVPTQTTVYSIRTLMPFSLLEERIRKAGAVDRRSSDGEEIFVVQDDLPAGSGSPKRLTLKELREWWSLRTR